MKENLRETIQKDQAILADPNASQEEKRKAHFDLIISRRLLSKGVEELQDPLDSIAGYLAKFCGQKGYIEQEKDPILSDFLAELYEQGAKIAAIGLAGPDATNEQMGAAMDTVKDRIRDFIKPDED
jgi:hypothetical protein